MKKLHSQAPPCFCLCGEIEPRSQALVRGNKAGVGRASFPGSCAWGEPRSQALVHGESQETRLVV